SLYQLYLLDMDRYVANKLHIPCERLMERRKIINRKEYRRNVREYESNMREVTKTLSSAQLTAKQEEYLTALINDLLPLQDYDMQEQFELCRHLEERIAELNITYLKFKEFIMQILRFLLYPTEFGNFDHPFV